MVSISRYKIIFKCSEHLFLVIATCPSECVCPSCGAPLCCHDHRERHVLLKSGIHVTLLVPRCRCLQCRRLHTLLPDFVVPYKHYEASVIQGVVDGKDLSACPAEDSTLRRWQSEFRRMAPYAETLLRKVQDAAYPLFGASLLAFLRQKFPRRWMRSVLPLLSAHGFFPATRFACCAGSACGTLVPIEERSGST